ncbi:MAG: FimV/HubP family polar landmark protein [Leptothrix sp. (in: b-proteobacteria)]
MSISRTLVVLALAAVPMAVLAAEPAVPAQVGDEPFTFRATVEKDTLWTIVAALTANGQVSSNQAMVAILRQNPDAFVRGNLHRLRKGVVLTIPSRAQMLAENRTKANDTVQAHLRLLTEGSTERAPLYGLSAVIAPTAAAPAASRPVAAVPAASRASAVVSVRPSPASAAASAPLVAASRQPLPVQTQAASAAASVVAAGSAVPVIGPSAVTPAAPPASGGGSYLPYAAGVVFLGAAWWAWRRYSESSSAAKGGYSADVDDGAGSGPRLVNVSTAAMDTARSLDAMKPVFGMVRKEGEPESVDAANLTAQATLKLELARAYIELRRHDEAYILLQFVMQHGSITQQHDADILLRGRS